MNIGIFWVPKGVDHALENLRFDDKNIHKYLIGQLF